MDTNKIFIDMAQRAHEFAEMCERMANETKQKADPEAWREEYRNKQAAGVKFECLCCDGEWEGAEANGWPFNFTLKKEDYREVPQESPKVKETGVGIPEAARNILIAWQRSGLKFLEAGEPVNFPLKFDCTMKGNYTIPEQPIPKGMSVETVEAMWRHGLRVDVDKSFNWPLNKTITTKHMKIPAQPIPEKLLEESQQITIEVGKRYTHVKSGKVYEVMSFAVNEADGVQMVVYRNVTAEEQWVRPESEFKEKFVKYMAVPLPQQQPHAAERALWKAQREAGTNEVWTSTLNGAACEIPADIEPGWYDGHVYRVKPMKLTARICMVGKAYPMSYIGQDWEFTGTREEYRAECEKYGYVVLSEIKEVVEKPKTVKYYFAMLNRYRCTPFGRAASDKDQIIEYAKKHRYTIIGDIEEREVEV